MVTIITIDESEKWDNVVKSFNEYDVSYLNGYAKAFQINSNDIPVLFYYDDKKTRAINVIMKRDIAKDKKFRNKLEKNKWFDVSTPYGYGGFLFEGNSYELVNESYEKYCSENGIISEFIRFGLFNNNIEYFNGDIASNTHNVVRDLTIPIDEIVIDFKHKVRTNIKRAIRSGVGIEIDNTGKRIDEFLEIYYQTMTRRNANEGFFFTKKFFEQLNKMINNYVYIHVLYGSEVVSTELLLYGPKNCYSFLGGTKEKYFSLRPNDLLKYETIKWAKNKGLQNLILGGGCGYDDNLYKYKKSFAPNGICDFYIGKRVFDESKYNHLIDIRKEDQKYNDSTMFFPLYRA